MPLKRRTWKRRLDAHAEVAIWYNLFTAGFDFFGEAAEHTGLTEPPRLPPGKERQEGEEAWLAAAEETWRRLGPVFLQVHGGLTRGADRFGRWSSSGGLLVPIKRLKAKPRRCHITHEAAVAFVAGEGLALHRALGLKPWEFTISRTADKCRNAEDVMAQREQIEAELTDLPGAR
jgi:hypothetical protein